jgi:hypothetical protein
MIITSPDGLCIYFILKSSRLNNHAGVLLQCIHEAANL